MSTLTERREYFRQARCHFAEFWASYLVEYAQDQNALAFDTYNIWNALQISQDEGMHATYLQIVITLCPFMITKGQLRLAETHLKRAEEIARQLFDTLSLTKILNSLSIVTRDLGGYVQAKSFAQEGLILARKFGYHQETSSLLASLGYILTEQGDYIEAEAYLQEGLELAEKYEGRKQIRSLLSSLGRLAGQRGAYEQAEKCFQEALKLAEEANDSVSMSIQLSNLGLLAARQRLFIEVAKNPTLST